MNMSHWDTLTIEHHRTNSNGQKSTSLWYNLIRKPIEYLYMQFLLVTTLYVMEPWERCLMMTIFVLVIFLVSYSAWVFIPYHLHHGYQWAKTYFIRGFHH